MTPKDLEILNHIFIGMIRAKDETEALTNLSGFKRKLDGLGLDIYSLGLFDKSAGIASLGAANAIIERRAMERALGDINDSSYSMIDEINEIRKASKANSATIFRDANGKEQKQIDWIRERILLAGEYGITRQQLESLHPTGKRYHQRFTDLIKEQSIFEIDDHLVHISFRNLFPDKYADFETKRKAKYGI
jgi:hypothetical protein